MAYFYFLDFPVLPKFVADEISTAMNLFNKKK